MLQTTFAREVAPGVLFCDVAGVRRIAPNFENCSLAEFKAAEKNAASNGAAPEFFGLRINSGARALNEFGADTLESLHAGIVG